MIVKPGKLKSLIISSKKDLSRSVLNINGVELTMESSVKLLGIEIDNKLNFEKRISNICRKTSNQLNAICRLETFMAQKKSNNKYFRLIWHFSSKTSQNKVEKIRGRSLEFLLNDYLSSYAELLEKSTSTSMETKRLRTMV